MRFGSTFRRALRRIQRKKKGAVVTVTALTVFAVLLLYAADPRRSGKGTCCGRRYFHRD